MRTTREGDMEGELGSDERSAVQGALVDRMRFNTLPITSSAVMNPISSSPLGYKRALASRRSRTQSQCPIALSMHARLESDARTSSFTVRVVALR